MITVVIENGNISMEVVMLIKIDNRMGELSPVDQDILNATIKYRVQYSCGCINMDGLIIL
jgi:hypothetical protein